MADQILARGYFSATEPGLVRASGGSVTSFLRADGVWTAPVGSGAPLTDGDKGDVIVSAGGTSWTIKPNSVDNSKLTQMSAVSFKGNPLFGTATPIDLTMTQARSMLGLPEVTWNLVAKSADTQFTSTTLTNVPQAAAGLPTMGWLLLALRVYHFKFVTVVRSAAASTGIGLGLLTPASSTFAAYGMMIGAAPSGPTTLQAEPITSSADPVVTTGVESTLFDYIFLIEGVIIPSESANLTLQARNEVGVTAVTVRVGSFGLLMERAP